MAVPLTGKAAEQAIESKIQQGKSPKEALIEVILQHDPNAFIGDWMRGPDWMPVVKIPAAVKISQHFTEQDFGRANPEFNLKLSQGFIEKYYVYPSGLAKTSMEFAGRISDEDLSHANVILTSGKYGTIIISGMRIGTQEIVPVRCTTTIDGELWIPVIRYQNPGSGRLFFEGDETPGQYCGNFYYLTSDVNIYLKSKKTMIVPLLDIAYYLLGGFGDSVNEFYRTWYQRIVDKCQSGESLNEEDYLAGHYKGLRPDLEHEDIDQPLCVLAREAGIDVIIVTYPFGREASAEVMDVRDRTVSFSSLVKSVNPIR